MTVNDPGDLDFETTPYYSLAVTADYSQETHFASGSVGVMLANVDEPGNEALTVESASFTIAENSVNATGVGTVTATDIDAGDTLTYAITAGNSDTDGDNKAAFAIDPDTGAMTVNDSDDIDFEKTPRFNLAVTVTDAGGLFDTADININLANINDSPTAVDDSGTGFKTDKNKAFYDGQRTGQ